MQPAGFIGKLRQLEEIRLRIAQIAFARVLHFVHQVRRVALIAGNAMAGVLGMLEKLLLLAGDVAGKAAGGVLLGECL